MLSLKNGTPTIATDYWYKVSDDHETKIGDLYRRLHLEDHYWYMPDLSDNLSDLKDRIEYYIYHPDTERILKNMEKESLVYSNFKNALRLVIDTCK